MGADAAVAHEINGARTPGEDVGRVVALGEISLPNGAVAGAEVLCRRVARERGSKGGLKGRQKEAYMRYMWYSWLVGWLVGWLVERHTEKRRHQNTIPSSSIHPSTSCAPVSWCAFHMRRAVGYTGDVLEMGEVS